MNTPLKLTSNSKKLNACQRNRCQALHMIKQYKNGYIINLTDAVISQYEATKKKNRHTLRSENLKWKP